MSENKYLNYVFTFRFFLLKLYLWMKKHIKYSTSNKQVGNISHTVALVCCKWNNWSFCFDFVSLFVLSSKDQNCPSNLYEFQQKLREKVLTIWKFVFFPFVQSCLICTLPYIIFVCNRSSVLKLCLFPNYVSAG